MWRRIEAVTGATAQQLIAQDAANLQRLGDLVRSSNDDLAAKVEQLLEREQQLKKELRVAQEQLAASRSGDLADGAQEIGGITVIAREVEGDAKAMMSTLDTLKSQFADSVILLGTRDGGRGQSGLLP